LTCSNCSYMTFEYMFLSFHSEYMQWSPLGWSALSIWSWCPTFRSVSQSPWPGVEHLAMNMRTRDRTARKHCNEGLMTSMDCDDCTHCLHSGLLWDTTDVYTVCGRSAHHISPSDGDIWKCWTSTPYDMADCLRIDFTVWHRFYMVMKIYILVFWLRTLWGPIGGYQQSWRNILPLYPTLKMEIVSSSNMLVSIRLYDVRRPQYEYTCSFLVLVWV
jgi:hypothetical protein